MGSGAGGRRLGPLEVHVLETPTLGDRSYLVHDGAVAAVVDPQRDVDRVLDLLEALQVRLVTVVETHLHNDYLTGGLALARATGAAYHLHADDEVAFDRAPVREGDVVAAGDLIRLTAIATPGHTFTHLSYALTVGDAPLSDASAVFTGGSLLFGATGRPDLLGAEHTQELARRQHASARRLAALLPDAAEVLPTHGFGSFCSATQSDATDSTIGEERRGNPVLTQDEQAYVEELLAGLGAYPAYYVHMGPGNARGPAAPDLGPVAEADPAELRLRLEAGEWVVDLRERTAFAAGHLRGSFGFGLDGGFATYLGWLIPWGTPLTLLGATPDDVAEAQRELVRIGIDRPAARATGSPEDWALAEGDVRSFERGTFADLAQVRHHREVTVLDVRRDDEHGELAVVGSLHVPLHQLLDRVDEVPRGEVWVHCASGYRAAVAASLLDAAGHHVVAVDDEWTNAPATGLRLAPGGGR